MKTILKKIRLHLNMSQIEFAEKLNISFATVNRWENGHSAPNKPTQSKIYDLCREHFVPVYDVTMERIKASADEIKLQENKILLYHGSKSGIAGKIQPKSRKQCDFGRGFYMGTDPNQALTLICDYEKSKFYIMSVDMNDLDILEVPSDIDWAMLVAYHRGKMEGVRNTLLYDKYHRMATGKDLIIGSIANDRMFYVIDNFFIGNITDMALVHSLSALQLGKQYVAVSQKSCDMIRIEKEISFSYLERMFLKDAAAENRAKGIALANDICKSYRREGLFFDEILEDAQMNHEKAGGRE